MGKGNPASSGSISAVPQRETVPDAVVRAADQVELVDMTPEALRRRMAHGNIYAADEIDAALNNYFRAGSIRLTPTEWHLLEFLLRHPGKLISQRQLLAEVRGPGYTEATGNLRLYMTQLRRKLEPDPARPGWLHTGPGMGYRYQPDAVPPAAEDGQQPG